MAKKKKSSYGSKYKYFEGKRYERVRLIGGSKSDAQATAKRLRKTGLRARVVKVPDGYLTYWKHSKKYSKIGRKKKKKK